MEKENNLTRPQGWGEEPVIDGMESQSDDRGQMEEGEPIFDLVDVIDDGDDAMPLVDAVEEETEGPAPSPLDGGMTEEIRKHVAEITERVAREMFPQIAERLIKEEIEKLKETVEE